MPTITQILQRRGVPIAQLAAVLTAPIATIAFIRTVKED